MDMEPSCSCDAELDDDTIGRALSSPLFIQEREEPVNMRLAYHFHRESCQLSFSPVRGDPYTNQVQISHTNGNQVATWKMIQSGFSLEDKEQILTEVRTGIVKHEFQTHSDRRNIFLTQKKQKHNRRSPSIKTILPRIVRMAFPHQCDTTCPDRWVQPMTHRKTLHMLSQASVSISAPMQRRPRAPEGWVLPVPWPVPITRRSLRLPHSFGPLSRWQQPQICTVFHSRAPGEFSPCRVWPGQHSAVYFCSSWLCWAPLKQGRSCAKTSMRLSSSAWTPRFMSLKNALYFTRAPASRQNRANMRSVGVASSELDQIECTCLDVVRVRQEVHCTRCKQPP